MIRVFVADSTRMYTQLLGEALSRDSRLQVTASPQELAPVQIYEAANKNAVDIVVLGSGAKEEGFPGIVLLEELRTAHPKIKGVVLLDSAGQEIVVAAFRAGARGLLTRNESLENLSKCVHQVHAGQVWATSEQINFAVDALAASSCVRSPEVNGLEQLSKREAEVVSCLAEGLSNREIAEKMRLSQHTIKNYLFRIFDKLGVSSRTELLSVTLRRSLPKSALTEGELIAENINR